MKGCFGILCYGSVGKRDDGSAGDGRKSPNRGCNNGRRGVSYDDDVCSSSFPFRCTHFCLNCCCFGKEMALGKGNILHLNGKNKEKKD
jgi:hypothetical protein